ncbi:Nucleotidyltransferase domain protein [Candidatus Methanoperedenaceae archaeon GB50]|nr:Nucleotidyltransferase domain protein [Candidatus Methanoperedenaceae archaeon GB50]
MSNFSIKTPSDADILEELLEKMVEQIKTCSKAVAVFLFGSYAKDTEKPLSDVDIAVILKSPDPEAEAEIGSLYSRKIDVVLFHRLPLHIQFEVLKDGREIFSRDDEYLFKIKMDVLRNYLETSWMYQRIASGVLR